MTDDLRFEREARDWLELGPVEAPAHVVQAAFFEIDATTQERGLRGLWRIPPTVRFALGTTVVVVVLAAAAGLVPLLARPAVPTDGQLRAASATIRFTPTWFSGDRVVFTATVPPTLQGERWRAATYDTYEGVGWIQTPGDITSVPTEADQPLLEGTAEQIRPDITRTSTVEVSPAGDAGNLLLAPGTPVSVNRATNVLLTGRNGWLTGVELADGLGDPYEVTAAALKIDATGAETSDGITESKLRAAGGQYPKDVLATYTDVPANAIGPNAHKLLDTMVALSPSDNPYDLASTFEAYLHSPANFKYDINLTDVDCGIAGAVECFATIKRGYCLQYASTMAILLRDAIPGHPIPTRLVQGFLPGQTTSGTTTVRIRDAHAWVEVYFPGYGWIPFDPTGNVGQPPLIPVGAPVPTPSQH